MFFWAVLPIALQVADPGGTFYDPEFSDPAASVIQDLRSGETENSVLIARLNQLADNGDDSALEALGEIHSGGLFGLTADQVRACDYFERVQSGRPDALHNLATCYFDGRGRERDFAKSRDLYAQAANGGFRRSYCAFGNMLVRGQGGAENPEEGVRLCRIAAAAGDAGAQTDYGGYLLMGIGTERDPVLARFILEQAEVQEQPNATFLLAQIHEKGDGTEQSDRTAQELYEKAYERGRDDAAFRVGLTLARQGFRKEGEEMFVVSELLEQSITWFELAARIDPDASVREQALTMIENTRVLIDAAN